ncbi:MAG: hypothetical protein WA982_15525 [Rubrobacteraceae bacterium]
MQSAREEVRDLERVRYVTENYEDLQGMKRVPIGLMVLIAYVFMVSAEFEITTKLVADIVLTLALLVAGALLVGHFWIRRYYENRYGRVRVVPRIFRRRRVYSGLAVLAMMFATFYLAGWVYEMQNVEPYPFFLILFGMMEVFDRWPELRFRPHHFFLGASMTLAGLLLLILVVQGNPYTESLFLHALVGFFVLQLTVGGILDHLLLVRTMKRLPEEANAVR